MIRGENVDRALALLKLSPQHNAIRLEKLLLSAISNWEAKNEDQSVEDADLYIKTIFVDSARQLKRLRPAPQGRANRIRKRSNHVTLIVDGRNEAPAKQEVKAEEEKKETSKSKKKAKAKAEA